MFDVFFLVKEETGEPLLTNSRSWVQVNPMNAAMPMNIAASACIVCYKPISAHSFTY